MKIKKITTLLLILMMSGTSTPSFAWHYGVTVSLVNDIASNIQEFVASGFHTDSLLFKDKNFFNAKKQGRAMHRYQWTPKVTTFMVGFNAPMPKLVNRCPMIDYCGHSTSSDMGNIHFLCASSFWRVEHDTTLRLKINKEYVLTCEREVSAFRTW